MRQSTTTYLGIDIGGTKCAVSVADRDGNVLVKKKMRSTGVSCEKVISRLIDIAKPLSKKHRCRRVGISCGGPLDAKKGIILSPPNLPGWDRVPIVKRFFEELKLPARLENDANAGALAEMYFGAAQGKKNIVFLTFGTGMGAGLILSGRLHRGACDMAGEIGHARMQARGPVGYHKSGSFEGFCSGGGLAQLLEWERKKFRGKTRMKASCTARDLAREARTGDPLALKVFSTSAKQLGLGLSILIDLLNPEMIVMGSIYARCRDLYDEELNRVLDKECLRENLQACQIVPAQLGEKIGDIAALSISLYHEKKRRQ